MRCVVKNEVIVFSTLLIAIIPIALLVFNDVVNENHFMSNGTILLSLTSTEEEPLIVTNIPSRPESVEKNLEFPTVLQSSHRFKETVNPKSVQKEGWTLIWQDEFENNNLESHLWNLENWAAEKNNELQFYTPDNVAVEGDHLKLISKEETYKNRNYTSGAIHTKDKFSFQYGKVEMRAKIPSGQGIFPAFWMLPNVDDTWLPEIDIMEMVGHNPDEIWMVVHWLDNEGNLTNVAKSHIGTDYSNSFHTYGIEWSPEKITWFIDEEELFSTSVFVPQVEMYLYLNTAVGGDWPGSPDETTIFPQYFEVDYVRVYQKEG